jgi:perosamine synthetase
LQAALGCAQIEHIDRIIQERERVYKTYVELLHKIDGIKLQYFSDNVAPVVWKIALMLDPSAFPKGRDDVIVQLKQRGIETRSGFFPPGAMPHLHDHISLKTCDTLSQRIISLPFFPSLTEEDIEYVCTNLAACKK